MHRSLQRVVIALALGATAACTRDNGPVSDSTRLADFAERYTAAWCSHRAADVAAFYAESGSLTINDGTPAVGRGAVQAAAQNFMSAYPDLLVRFDRLEPHGDRVLYHWTFIGRNTGPGGTGHGVRISGYEDWRIGADGLIADSQGHYDAREWDRQLHDPAVRR